MYVVSRILSSRFSLLWCLVFDDRRHEDDL